MEVEFRMIAIEVTHDQETFVGLAILDAVNNFFIQMTPWSHVYQENISDRGGGVDH